MITHAPDTAVLDATLRSLVVLKREGLEEGFAARLSLRRRLPLFLATLVLGVHRLLPFPSFLALALRPQQERLLRLVVPPDDSLEP